MSEFTGMIKAAIIGLIQPLMDKMIYIGLYTSDNVNAPLISLIVCLAAINSLLILVRFASEMNTGAAARLTSAPPLTADPTPAVVSEAESVNAIANHQ